MPLLLLAACGAPPRVLSPTDADRRVVLTAPQVAPYLMVPGPIDPAREAWKLEHDASRWAIEYEYSDDHLRLHHSAIIARSASDADWAYVGFGLGRTFIDGTDGVEVISAPELLPWGDESDCDLIRTSGIDAGFVCRGKKGERAFMATVFGVSPIGPARPTEILAASLAALEQWRPVEP